MTYQEKQFFIKMVQRCRVAILSHVLFFADTKSRVDAGIVQRSTLGAAVGEATSDT